jgi:hypothetical protein
MLRCDYNHKNRVLIAIILEQPAVIVTIMADINSIGNKYEIAVTNI